jgi:hypothetical protein
MRAITDWMPAFAGMTNYDPVSWEEEWAEI